MTKDDAKDQLIASCLAMVVVAAFMLLGVWGMWHYYHLLTDDLQILAKFVICALFFFNLGRR